MCYVAKSGIVLSEKLIYVMAFEKKGESYPKFVIKLEFSPEKFSSMASNVLFELWA